MKVIGNVLRVLAIEDSEDDLELIRNELSEGGFTVVHDRVETVEALKAALEYDSWDVVICDHNLPALNSLCALKIVQSANENMPFILVSGQISDALAIDAMHCGAKDFIRKDNLSRLTPAVKRELRQKTIRAELKAAQENLHLVSHFDKLTGLPNRDYLFNHLNTKISLAEEDYSFALVMIDINRFRNISKSVGMLLGNQILIETARRLASVFDNHEFIARLGVDTFVAVVPYLNEKDEAAEIANAIHRRMDEIFRLGGHELFVKTSIGVSFYPEDARQFESLFKNAESALYRAKLHGVAKNYQVYQADMDAAGENNLLLETALHHALEKEQFVLHYQPQFDLASGCLIGAEALLRWRHPEFGMISPNNFIPILEDTGLVVPVGEWVLRAACAQNKQWQEQGFEPISIAVNLSAIQFQQPGLAQTVRRVLEQTGLSPRHLELEITENVAMQAEEEVLAILSDLRALGIQIAIDDFGTGYSSLSYLKRFPINKLKIDRSFVNDLGQGLHDDSLLQAIIGMGHSLKLTVIAEGVETQAQTDILKLNGCDEVQGYFFGRPMSAADLGILLAQSSCLVAA